MKKSLFFIALAITVVLQSCSTEFEVNDKWQDITVVFGLLDQDDTAQYIKINKAFLGEEDAYIMASVSDSLYYDSLTVSMAECISNDTIRTIYFYKTVDELEKQEGIFATDNHVLYKSSSQLNEEAEYRLKITVPGKADAAYASTSMINGLLVKKPTGFTSQAYNIPVNLATSTNFELYSAENAKIYDLSMWFYYYETYDGEVFKADSILWDIPTVYSSDIDGGEKIEIELSGESFCRFLKSQLEIDASIIRMARSPLYNDYYSNLVDPLKGPVDITISMGGEDLYTYIEINRPSQGINQEKPVYSNVENGLGLFASRNSLEIKNKSLSNMSYDTIAQSKICRDLNFLDSNGKLWWQ